jgi:drug/metabolite transporter (DMT)-like permease
LKLSSPFLFVVSVLIWGSTFFAIKFQYGEVDPLWSVSYRHLLAGIILIPFCFIRGLPMRFTFREHMRMLMQGILLFGLNYWLTYLAEQTLTSALMAVAFSALIFLNIYFGKLFLNKPSDSRIYLGASVGFIGTILLFYQELEGIKFSELPVWSLVFTVLSVLTASLGNITSAANQSKGIPIVQSNGYAMLYGGIVMGIIALFMGKAPTMDTTTPYVVSLLYLTVFGSIIAFGTYLNLIGRWGPGKAAYALVVIPVIAIILSVLFENYPLSWLVGLGMVAILMGNKIILSRRQ